MKIFFKISLIFLINLNLFGEYASVSSYGSGDCFNNYKSSRTDDWGDPLYDELPVEPKYDFSLPEGSTFEKIIASDLFPANLHSTSKGSFLFFRDRLFFESKSDPRLRFSRDYDFIRVQDSVSFLSEVDNFSKFSDSVFIEYSKSDSYIADLTVVNIGSFLGYSVFISPTEYFSIIPKYRCYKLEYGYAYFTRPHKKSYFASCSKSEVFDPDKFECVKSCPVGTENYKGACLRPCASGSFRDSADLSCKFNCSEITSFTDRMNCTCKSKQLGDFSKLYNYSSGYTMNKDGSVNINVINSSSECVVECKKGVLNITKSDNSKSFCTKNILNTKIESQYLDIIKPDTNFYKRVFPLKSEIILPFDPNKPKPTPPNNDDNTKPNDKPNKPNDGDNNPSKPQPKPPVTPDKPNPSQPTPPNSNDNTKPNKPDNSSSDDNTKPNDDNSNPNNGGSGNDFGTSNNSLIKPGGSTTETIDNNSSGSGKNDNSGKGNNDNNSSSGAKGDSNVSSDYSGEFGTIIDTLKKIEKNTGKNGDNDLSKFFKDDGSLDKFKKGNPFDYNVDDPLGALKPESVVDKFLGKLNSVDNDLEKLKDSISKDNLPTLKNIHGSNSCPISVNFNNGPINKVITWDLCSVMAPYADVFYPLFYLIFLSIFVPLSFRMVSYMIKGA